MQLYNVSYINKNGKVDIEEFHTLDKAKECMKKHPQSKGIIINIFSNGDWEELGEITLNE